MYSTGPGPLLHYFQWLEDVFTRAEPRRHAYKYLCWLLSRPAPPGSEDGRNRLLTTARWDEDQVRDRVRDLVVGHLGSRKTSLVISEEGFVKKGSSSAGVTRQYCATSGRIENCQIGVFLLHRDTTGNTVAIDRELLIPPPWAENPAARRHAGIPDRRQCASREAAALAMINRALDSGMPARWVVADAPYYGDSAAFRRALEHRRVPYVLASNAGSPLVSQRAAPGGYVRWQLGRREGGSYVCYAPARTDLGELAAAASYSQAVPAHFASARGEAGLDRYSVRKWRSWYRHMTLAMFAHAVLRITACRPTTLLPN
ncbi:hypothetical protein BFF78_11215 [Streptomyces fodineus]|uniref:Transposase IS701-like DDE domain-containing protein n=1 Tax=Streptomyces fodineus TaxID=1904616 RepID=A0A1D7YN66_9ACTN|nr:hypothetical protein BFF78_11215 [Streptomyces fodineus]